MRILHTADLHLRENGDNRWQALEKILLVGRENHIDVLVISGDLFDTSELGEQLRDSDLRSLFSGNPFKRIFIIRGNHDEHSFKTNYWFGNDVKVFHDPFEIEELEDTRFIGLPFSRFTSSQTLELLREIDHKLDEKKTNILLFHGDLRDIVFVPGSYGDESNMAGYMPLSLADLKRTKLHYVLAGHIHTKFEVCSIDSDRYFIYPGSPVSVTKKEIGRRSVNVFDVGSPPNETHLDTMYYYEIRLMVLPSDAISVRDRLKDEVAKVPDNAKIILILNGFVAEPETTLIEDLKAICGSKLEPSDIKGSIRDSSQVICDDLFLKCRSKILAEFQDPGQQRALEKLMLEFIAKIL